MFRAPCYCICIKKFMVAMILLNQKLKNNKKVDLVARNPRHENQKHIIKTSVKCQNLQSYSTIVYNNLSVTYGVLVFSSSMQQRTAIVYNNLSVTYEVLVFISSMQQRTAIVYNNLSVTYEIIVFSSSRQQRTDCVRPNVVFYLVFQHPYGQSRSLSY